LTEFSRNDDQSAKKQRQIALESESTTDETLFQLLAKNQVALVEKPPAQNIAVNVDAPIQEGAFGNFVEAPEAPVIEVPKGCKNLPIDWSLKTRLRFLSKTPIPGNNLKTNQEASGLTSFVRCIDHHNSSTTGLDISPGARFFQGTFYWQHPHLPWLTLFPRNAKTNVTYMPREMEQAALAKEWTESFRNLYQLLRARQCPYFYVCANTFTVLFRAAGVGGRAENHALLTPTSRGMRAALKQDDIEFTMPLKKTSAELNRSNDSGTGGHNSSFSNSSEEQSRHCEESDDDDDLDGDNWLESMGIEAEEIKKISYNQMKKRVNKETEEDYSDQSTVLVEGADCQAFFNFLLNCKSATTKVGKLAGIPPTLIAPVSFIGASLKTLAARSSKVRMDAEEYHSTELHGVILPHVLPYLGNLLAETKDTFSATMVSARNTVAFCSASQAMINDVNKENDSIGADSVFGKENLSDCGLTPRILDAMVRSSKESVVDMERMIYNAENGGFTWS
jgi:hypothetical protein